MLKVRKNGQQKKCNWSYNIAAKRVEQQLIAMMRFLPPTFKPVNNLICCMSGLMWVVKRATQLFNSFCYNVARQVVRFLLLVFPYLKVMLDETIRNDDFQRNTALQHCCDVVSNCYNIAPKLQRCVALKISVANCLVGDGSENSIKIDRSNEQKNTNLHVRHTFLYISLRLFCTTKTYVVVVCDHQKFCCLCSCSLCFHCRSFFTLLAASISHFLTAAMKLSCFSSNEIRLLCFQSLALAFSLLSA